MIAARTAAVVAAVSDVIIITGDSGVHQWGMYNHLVVMREPDKAGLDGAAATLRDHAISVGRPWLLLHADLPLISTDDVIALLTPLQAGRAVIAPSHDGGTSGLGASGRIEFRYGTGSYHRHLRQLPTAAVVVRPGLGLDLDTVADLDGILRHRRGDWIRTILAAIDSPT
jgi:2-phospho-L-lactate guanylyltransferase (CobY/MobA/RfbA family)